MRMNFLEYSFDMGIWNSVFAVPTSLIDKHLKLAGKDQLKVILWILRHAGESFSCGQIAKSVGIRDEVAEEAIEYWIDCGILAQNKNSLTPAESPIASPPGFPSATEKGLSSESKSPEPQKEAPELPKKRLLKPDGLYVAKRVNESPKLRMLMEETETTLGKTLSPALTSTLVSVHEDLGLPVEVIIMLIEYTKSIGKSSTKYIESVAFDWARSEIFTIDAAEKKLAELDEKSRAWRRLEGIMGIFHRAPTKKESEAAYTWFSSWKMNDELVTEAYERCIERTGKMSIAYMNKILDSWHSLGYQTLEQVKAEAEKAKDEKTKSYDENEISGFDFFNLTED